MDRRAWTKEVINLMHIYQKIVLDISLIKN